MSSSKMAESKEAVLINTRGGGLFVGVIAGPGGNQAANDHVFPLRANAASQNLPFDSSFR